MAEWYSIVHEDHNFFIHLFIFNKEMWICLKVAQKCPVLIRTLVNQVWAQGCPVHMSRKETSALQFLLRPPSPYTPCPAPVVHDPPFAQVCWLLSDLMLSFIHSTYWAPIRWSGAHTPALRGSSERKTVKVDLHDVKGNLSICLRMPNLGENSPGKTKTQHK